MGSGATRWTRWMLKSPKSGSGAETGRYGNRGWEWNWKGPGVVITAQRRKWELLAVRHLAILFRCFLWRRSSLTCSLSMSMKRRRYIRNWDCRCTGTSRKKENFNTEIFCLPRFKTTGRLCLNIECIFYFWAIIFRDRYIGTFSQTVCY